jgi:hypothetical protein
MRTTGPVAALLAALAMLAVATPAARADTPAERNTVLDRVVVRWQAPETGGPAYPQFIFERELAFEARIEALADPDLDSEPGPYHERHIRAALERHIAESLLAKLPVLKEPGSKAIAALAEVARGILEQRVHGRARLIAAAAAEGMGSGELDALLRRQAKASVYLDQMVAPMLETGELELRDLLRSGATPFKDRPFDAVKDELSRWYVGQRLAQAVEAYFQNARSRVVIHVARRTAK